MVFAITLSIGIVVVSGTALLILLLRETRRGLALDRRLSVSRGEALKLSAARAAAARDGDDGVGLFSSFAMAAVRGASVLVPFGSSEREKLTKLLQGAGFRHPEALAAFLCVKLVAALAAGAAVSLLGTRFGFLGQQPVLIGFLFVAGAIVGSLLPEIVLRVGRSRRSQGMAAVLPSALDLLVMCLEAGLTLERSVHTTAEELRAIETGLADELRALEAELRVGTNHRAVLQDFHQRTNLDGLKDFAVALLQSERYGTSLTQAMRNIAESERNQRAARIEEQAERLPVLMTLPTMLLVLPGTMLLMAGPAFLQAMQAIKSIS